MSERACILTGAYDIPEDQPGGPRKEQKTWCGRATGGWGWAYQDPTHAALAGKAGARVLACEACLDALAAALAGLRATGVQ